MADCFRDLVRYVLLKTHRDMETSGASAACFTPRAMEENLRSRANAGIFGEREPSVVTLMERARDPDLIFHFAWKAPGAKVPFGAEFGLGFEDDDLKVRLLWLDLPSLLPGSPRPGPARGRGPLEEAVTRLLRVSGDGRLEPYPPPV